MKSNQVLGPTEKGGQEMRLTEIITFFFIVASLRKQQILIVRRHGNYLIQPFDLASKINIKNSVSSRGNHEVESSFFRNE